MKISRLAVGDRTLDAVADRPIAPPAALAQDRHIEGLPLGTRGGMLVTHTFPLDAEYEFSVSADGGGRGGGGGGRRSTSRSTASRSRSTNPRSFRIKVTAGPHTIGVALVDRQRGAGVDEHYSDFRIDCDVHARRAASRRSSITGRSTPPAPATRRAGGGSSSASRRRADGRSAVRAHDPHARWRAARTAGRCATPKSTR